MNRFGVSRCVSIWTAEKSCSCAKRRHRQQRPPRNRATYFLEHAVTPISLVLVRSGIISPPRRSGTSACDRTAERVSARAARGRAAFVVQVGADRHDARRVQVRVAAVVVALDEVDVHGVGDAGHLIHVAHEPPEVRVVDDAAAVALEVAVVDGVEADQRREQANVGFGEPRARQIAPRREPRPRACRAPRTTPSRLPRTLLASSRSRRGRRRC